MAGSKLDPYEDIVRGHIAAGHDNETIARVLSPKIPGGVSRHAVRRFLAKKAIGRPAPTQAEPVAVDDPLRVKIDALQAQLSVSQKEIKAYAKALATQEEFYARIVEASRVPVKTPSYRVKPRAKTSKPSRSVVVPIYDQQFGQLVRPSDTPGGRGEYSSAIYDQRQKRWLEGVTGNIRDYAESHQIEELVIVFGGDHVEGDEIFAGQPWQLELDPCRQVWELACKMDAAVTELVRFAKEEIGVPWIACYGVDDNHGKVGGKRSGARPSTYSWNWLFLTLLKDKLRAQPIDQFEHDPAGAIFFYAAGLEFQAVHGHHNIKGWGGIPYYGIQRYDAKSVRLHNRLFRFLLMGHIHQPAEITVGSGAEAIVSGDWVGANNLSGPIAAASRPQQKVLYAASKWGITETARIYLTDAEEAFEPSPIYGRAG
jgi:hypothetical protein